MLVKVPDAHFQASDIRAAQCFQPSPSVSSPPHIPHHPTTTPPPTSHTHRATQRSTFNRRRPRRTGSPPSEQTRRIEPTSRPLHARTHHLTTNHSPSNPFILSPCPASRAPVTGALPNPPHPHILCFAPLTSEMHPSSSASSDTSAFPTSRSRFVVRLSSRH